MVLCLDKYNYARWATVYWFDLVSMEHRCPNEYKELMAGNFSFQKTKSLFSRMALDQVHEQKNKYIKSVSGATSLVNRQEDSALVRWELCGPELFRLLEEFETVQCDEPAKHHENTKTFNSDFYNDVFKLLSKFSHNPFLLSELTVVDNAEHLFEENVFYNISRLESMG